MDNHRNQPCINWELLCPPFLWRVLSVGGCCFFWIFFSDDCWGIFLFDFPFGFWPVATGSDTPVIWLTILFIVASSSSMSSHVGELGGYWTICSFVFCYSVPTFFGCNLQVLDTKYCVISVRFYLICLILLEALICFQLGCWVLLFLSCHYCIGR